eukprot:4352235-Prymnesium_polylepis.1
MHDSSNATEVESREEIAMESRFSRPLERVVQARGRETMPLRLRDDLPGRRSSQAPASQAPLTLMFLQEFLPW